MLSLRIYYSLKPYMPWRLRMALRRIHANRLLKANRANWPISESAARIPEGWTGWPERKKFAFVLTHDVEGADGLAKCRMLAELEMKMGFRSAFNFIPEGSYTVPDSLRTWLTENGFEVGVHDLRHDGMLFSSREKFTDNARRINHYIDTWNARGFRAGFMLRKLDWLHDLKVGYDASTFDTDPFEFQPDGVGTIFPFWIPATARGDSRASNAGRGYVELPYTLPQDSTLFLVLREKTPDIWLRKLDWVAKNQGMALINVHPDYLCFDHENPSARTFPIAHYVKLLEHLRERHAGDYWQALPKEVAEHAARIKPHQPPSPKSVCMVTHSFYENDNRVIRYAEALASRGDHVDVLALRRSPQLSKTEVIDGVHLHRIISRPGKKERSKFSYFSSWIRFLAKSSWWVLRQHRRNPYDILHVHNMPDFLVYAALLPRMTGARVILDIHDIVPEFYTSKFGIESRTFTRGLLEFAERCSAQVADHVIISNHLWLKKYAARTGTEDRCSVFINNVNARLFAPRHREGPKDRKVIIFPGGLQWHQGLDIALRAFAKVSETLPDTDFHIYGDGNMKPSLMALASELKLDDRVRFFDPINVKDVARLMAEADLGIVPKRADSFGNEAYSTKIMEFMSVGVPVVVSSTKIDRFYFNGSVVRFFESGNVSALADAIVGVMTDDPLRQSLIKNGLAYADANSWTRRHRDYLEIVDNLAAGRPVIPMVAIDGRATIDASVATPSSAPELELSSRE